MSTCHSRCSRDFFSSLLDLFVKWHNSNTGISYKFVVSVGIAVPVLAGGLLWLFLHNGGAFAEDKRPSGGCASVQNFANVTWGYCL